MIAACLQQQIEPCKTSENLSRALQLARAALACGARVLALPELFLTGFCYEPAMQSYAGDRPPYPSLDPLRALSRENGCLFAGSIRDGRQNLGFALDGEGVQIRPKIHLFGAEKEHFDGGTAIRPVETRWAGSACRSATICAFRRWPEPWLCWAQSCWSQWPSSGLAPRPVEDAVPGQGYRESDSAHGLQLGERRRLSHMQCTGEMPGRGGAWRADHLCRAGAGGSRLFPGRVRLPCRQKAGVLPDGQGLRA